MKPYHQRLVALIFAVSVLVLSGPCLNAQVATPSPNAAPAQSFDTTFGNTRWFPNVWGPYLSPYVPESKMSNSERLHSLLI